MKIFLRCADDDKGWIIGKFAERLREELVQAGMDVTLGQIPTGSYDVCHHLGYWMFEEKLATLDTLMVTHIDKWETRHMLSKALSEAELGICMSSHTMQNLRQDLPVSPDRFCYIHPAHDGELRPRPIHVGITSRLYRDGRKNENMLMDLKGLVDPQSFRFSIMGAGWGSLVDQMQAAGFQVDYAPDFDRASYAHLITSLDYYLYLGHDEGSMGFLDAVASGVETIVTPQGFHLDVPDGITHAISGRDDFRRVFKQLEANARKRSETVAQWSWARYARKHLEVWSYLLNASGGVGSGGSDESTVSDGADGVQSLVGAETVSTRKSGQKLVRLLGIVWFDYILRGWTVFRGNLRSLARRFLGSDRLARIWVVRRGMAKRLGVTSGRGGIEN